MLVFAFDASAFNANASKQGAAPGGTLGITLDGASQSTISVTQVPVPTTLNVDPQPTFVFEPNAPSILGSNVFTTWADLMAAVALSPGNKTIYIDDTNGAANTSPGTFSLEGCFLTSKRTAAPTLHIVEGTVFTNTTRFIIEDSLTISSDATATVPLVSSAGVNPFIRPQFRGACVVKSTTAIPFMQKSAGGSISILAELQAGIGDGAHPMLTVDAGQTAVITATAISSLFAHAVAGAGTLTLFQDASCVVSAQDVAVTNVTLFDKAAQVAYTPGTAGNWQPAPTLVSAALDQLAAPNVTQAANNTGTGTGTITITTGNISKLRSGKMVVTANIAGESTGPGTITLQLVRDAATNIGNPIAITALSANDDFSMSMTFIDTAPDSAAHTYKFTATASAGNITCAATSGQLSVFEL